MRNRASTANLALSLAAFAFFMVVVKALFGFGFGLPELGIWLVLLVVGTVLIVRRYHRARLSTATSERS